jgi:hypothetical protein
VHGHLQERRGEPDRKQEGRPEHEQTLPDAGGCGEEQEHGGHCLDGHHDPNHDRNSPLVLPRVLGEPIAPDEREERVVNRLDDPDHSRHEEGCGCLTEQQDDTHLSRPTARRDPAGMHGL